MRTPLVLSFLMMGSILFGIVQPSSAAETLVGGYSEVSVTNEQVIAAAQFAVKTQALSVERAPVITLVEILKAEQQVVAGMNYRLRLKVKVDETVREAKAVVWRQAWRKPDPYRLTSWAWKQGVQMTVRPVRFDPKGEPRKVFIGENTNAISTVEELQARVTALPAGTELSWNSGCYLYECVPVGTNRIPMKDFVNMCEKAGLTFSYSCGF
jgi:cystatin-C